MRSTHTGPPLGARPWQDRIEAALRGTLETFGAALEGGLGAGDGAALDAVTFSLVKDGPRALGVAVVAAGRVCGHLKLFDGPGGREAYKRERDMLVLMRETRLVPRLKLFCFARRFLLTEPAGRPLGPAQLEAWGADEFGYMLGAWHARFEAAAPSERSGGTWADMVQDAGFARHLDTLPGAEARLRAIPVIGLTVAANDAALHNFLVDETEALRRCDFEAACFRPRGWDFLRARHAVMQRFPDRAAEILAGMAEGFAAHHRGGLRIGELTAVGDVLFCVFARAGRPDGEAA